ncbi:Calcium homeostasis endoplasmic reticulum protein [Acropora cervicornis]|uniref:Calcium homeostasis endoplasmic reticulum protein n=1 Tax=Acropora cervicornis TaxID=6130 RepID=A0AAD9UYH8_ACRCE|nr:Calcium homeostasis endoplasmic reticulum protein [Acropora cervicornis]
MSASVVQNPPFPPPEDQEQKNIIDKLANFVARNGSKFEEMTKEKQKGNPKFAFLFSGEYYNYYRWKVSFEIAQQQTQQHLQSQQQLVQQAAAQYGTNPQAHLVQQAIVQQSINSAPWQHAQQQAQQQMQVLQQQQAQVATVPLYPTPAAPVQQAVDVDITELESLLCKIMESCTKDSISSGKNYIFSNAKTPAQCYQTSQYLLKRALGPGMQFQHKLHIVYLINDILHHCQRKGAQDLQEALNNIVVPVFFATQLGESAENLQKINKKLKNSENAQSAVDAARHQVFGTQESSAGQNLEATAQENQDEPPRVQTYPPAPYQPPPGFPPSYSEQHPPYYGHAPPPFPPRFPPPPGYMPDFHRPPPMFGHPPPPNFRDEGFHGRPPPFHGPPQQFDYQQQEYEQYTERGPPPPPVMGNEFNRGRPEKEEDFTVDEYDIPPDPPVPEPIIPSAMYYELPAGLMAPLVGLPDVEYKPLDPAALRLPAPQPPSERLLAAVEAFYSPPSHERPRNSPVCKSFFSLSDQGLVPDLLAVRDLVPCLPVNGNPGLVPELPEDATTLVLAVALFPQREEGHAHVQDHGPVPDHAPAPGHAPSHDHALSRRCSSPIEVLIEVQLHRVFSDPSYVSKTLEERIDESNVGHQMLKKMGWSGAGLGKTQQGIHNPISGGEVRDKFDKFKGVGSDMNDPFEAYRKSKSYSFIDSRIAKSEAKAAARREAIKEASKRDQK